MPDKRKYKIILWGIVIVFLISFLVFSVIFVINFPKNYPDKTLVIEEKVTSFLNTITLPIKIAKLSNQEPDTSILVPVYGRRVSHIADTWQAPRGDGRLHEGQDIFASKGTPVFSATKGYVLRITNTELGGNAVYVIGAGGRRYYYAHLDSFPAGLSIGQLVTTDTIIGFVGNTGNAENTPPHLHLGVYERREAIDPLPLLVDRK